MSIDLTQLLDPKAILLDLASRSRDEVLLELTGALALAHPHIKREEIARALAERERDGSTGIGLGVAIPHARLPGVQKNLLAFGRSNQGLDFGSIDNKPVHLFFLLVVPEDGSYLKELARLSQLCQDSAFVEHLRAATSPKEILSLLKKGR